MARTKREYIKRRNTVIAILAGFFVAGAAVGATGGVICERLSNKEATEPQPIICPCECSTETETLIAEAKTNEYKYLGNYRTTAYCACAECCGEWADGTTASGEKAIEGITVAVDPNIIPFGTTLMIAGEEYTAQDSGSAIKGHAIDIYFNDHDTALAYGVQQHDVYIKGAI